MFTFCLAAFASTHNILIFYFPFYFHNTDEDMDDEDYDDEEYDHHMMEENGEEGEEGEYLGEVNQS